MFEEGSFISVILNYNLRNKITNCCEQVWEKLQKGLAFKVKFEYHDE